MKKTAKRTVRDKVALPVKAYRRIQAGGTERIGKGERPCLVKVRIFLDDRPGSLAALSTLISGFDGNISFFHYDRAVDSSRVLVEVQMPSQKGIEGLLRELVAKRYSFEKTRRQREEVVITKIESILEIKVRLRHEPGTLAAFSRLLKKHDANVIYMLYDEDIDQESADVALATRNPQEIDSLLDAINRQGYLYKVVYRGSDEAKVGQIIGLKLVEKFFLRLKDILGEKDIEDIKALVDSSQELSTDLIDFYSEAGNNLDTADVFEKVVALASMSRSRTGPRFSVLTMPPLAFGRTRLFGFRLPTSEAVYVLEHGGEVTMIDSGSGVYYSDLKRLLRQAGLDPAKVRRIFVTHADADHAGTSGAFAREFGTTVCLHPGSRGVIQHRNRVHGASGRLLKFNKYFTRLVSRFTECQFPDDPVEFPVRPVGRMGTFPVIGTIEAGDLSFKVLESHGGHAPGHVFFLEPKNGLLFSSDYLINVKSLTPEERGSLGVYKYLLTSPNSDSALFRSETAALTDLMRGIDRELRRQGGRALIFPGHGEYYPADKLDK